MLISVIKKLNALLDRKQKVKIALLMVMILIGGLMETIGVSLIVPLVSAFTDKEAFMQQEIVQAVSERLRIADADTFILFIIFGLITIYVLKNGYLIFLYYIQARFVNNNRCRVSKNLLSQYLHRPYEYYLYADTATILRTIYGDMDNVFNLLLQCMNLAAEAIVAVCLCVVLLLFDFKMAIAIVAVLGLTTLFITKVIKPKLHDTGEDSRQELGQLYKWILQSVSGIKDVKTLNKETHFVEGYGKSARNYAKLQTRNNVLVSLPRLLIETVAIAAILLYVAVVMISGADTSMIFPLITAFGVAAIRLLPSVNRVNTYIANISYYESALDYIYENVDMEQIRQQEQKDSAVQSLPAVELTLQDKIELEHITFRYPNTEKDIFRDAHMVIPIGESVGVVGPSGAGKTTIVDVLLGLLALQEGRITTDGTDIFDNYAGWLSHVGYIPQTIYMLDDSIRNNIAFGVKAENIEEERVWEVLEEAQMKTFVEQLPEGLDTQIGERGVRISGGQRQRLGIARALYHDPELLIFDEATSALDTDTETAIMEAIDKLHGHKTMVIIAHRLRTIENCDMIYEVKDGKIMPHSL